MDGVPEAAPEACAEAEARAELTAGDEPAECDEPEARGELDADAPCRPVAEADAELPDDREACPFGDGVRVPECEPDDGFAGGVGVKVVGADEPPAVQAEAATAMRTAPAAERPAVSHALRAPPGPVRRFFMKPPRMRVR